MIPYRNEAGALVVAVVILRLPRRGASVLEWQEMKPKVGDRVQMITEYGPSPWAIGELVEWRGHLMVDLGNERMPYSEKHEWVVLPQVPEDNDIMETEE